MDFSDSGESEIDEFELNFSEGEQEDECSQNEIINKSIVNFDDNNLDDEVIYGSNKSTQSHLARPAELRDECFELVQESESQRHQEI